MTVHINWKWTVEPQVEREHGIWTSDIFIKDRVDSGEVSIQRCPTDEMVGDYFTKPLQGALFVTFRDLIMGYDEHDMKLVHESPVSPRSVLDNVWIVSPVLPN